MTRLKEIASEPLVHFLIGGALLLLVFTWSSRERAAGGASRRIIVEEDGLRDFVSSRTQLVDPLELDRAWQALDESTQRDWIRRYVREEALVREARVLGLDRGDELIRRRLVQKMEFLALGLLEADAAIDAAELAAAYALRREDYRMPALLSFSHVFVRTSPDDETGAIAHARALLAELNRRGSSAAEALALGDRFLYSRSYVDRTLAEVRSHFGDAMATTLTTLEPDSRRWTGPHRSDHGLHLVLLTAREPARIPPLEEIRDVLAEELRRERRERLLDAAIDEIVSRYQVEIDADTIR